MPITKTYDMLILNGVKGWIRDSWARRKIADIQTAIAGIVVPTASTANPQMDGTAAPGSSADYARADHIHPHDTSKADAATTYTKTEVNNLIPSVPSASTASPAMDGTASPGSSTDYSRADHVHPTDTSRQSALGIATGTLPSTAGSFSNYLTLPDGFTASNTIVIGFSIYRNNEWRGGEGAFSNSFYRAFFSHDSTGIRVSCSYSGAVGCDVRVVLMRTDI